MERSTEPKSVHAMTEAERRELLRRREPADAGERGMEIGGHGPMRRVLAVTGRLMAMLALAAVFVVMFYRFTASWKIAMIVVGGMLAYMLAVGRMVEGSTDRIE